MTVCAKVAAMTLFCVPVQLGVLGGSQFKRAPLSLNDILVILLRPLKCQMCKGFTLDFTLLQTNCDLKVLLQSMANITVTNITVSNIP